MSIKEFENSIILILVALVFHYCVFDTKGQIMQKGSEIEWI